MAPGNPDTPAPVYSPLWKQLYNTIHFYLKAVPWNLFENEDVFLVEDPVDRQLYLCTILGAGGEEFGLNVMRGPDGLRAFLSMINRAEDEGPDRNIGLILDMISFTLCERMYLETRDLSVTRKLLLNYQADQWPHLRSYRPGYFPWFLTEAEIRVLIMCLEQTLMLTQEGEDIIEEIRGLKDQWLVRRLEGGEWRSAPARITIPAAAVPQMVLDDMTLQRVRQLQVRPGNEEVDLFHMLAPVKEGSVRPYLPQVLAGIDSSSAQARQYGLYKPGDDRYNKAVRAIFDDFVKRGWKPEGIILREGTPFGDAFAPLCTRAGIVVTRLSRLEQMDGFIAGLDDQLMGHNSDWDKE